MTPTPPSTPQTTAQSGPLSGPLAQPRKIELGQMAATMKEIKEVHHVDTFMGAMMTTQGILLLFFSHRFNREIPLVVSGTETSKVLLEVGRHL